jgi:hypothetical protein
MQPFLQLKLFAKNLFSNTIDLENENKVVFHYSTFPIGAEGAKAGQRPLIY